MVNTKKEQKILDETILLVKMFLKTNLSDIELSNKTHISSSTVGRRLTNKKVILKCFPSNGEKIYELIREKRKDNLKKAKVLGSLTSKINNNESISNLRLDAVYRNKTDQVKFLSHIALYFRAKLPLLSTLFNISEKELLNDLIVNNNSFYESLLYLFYQDNFDQELAKSRIIEYYKDKINAISKKDAEMHSYLINLIGDSKVAYFKLNHKSLDSNEDAMNLLMYQLKYALSNDKMREKFELDENDYINKVENIIKDKEELKERYKSLVSFYEKEV